MDFLVVSDTHGARHNIRRMLQQINFRPSAVLFLGDGVRDLSVLEEHPLTAGVSVYAVAGNCDVWSFSPVDAPEVRIEVLGGRRVVLMHGHTFGVKSGLGAAIRYAAQAEADVLLFGHTHTPMEQTLSTVAEDEALVLKKPLLIANPGSLACGASTSFGVLSVQGDNVLFSHGRVE